LASLPRSAIKPAYFAPPQAEGLVHNSPGPTPREPWRVNMWQANGLLHTRRVDHGPRRGPATPGGYLSPRTVAPFIQNYYRKHALRLGTASSDDSNP